MVTLVVLQKNGPLTRRLTVSAASVERAVQIARYGAEEARVVFPIDGELFFAPVGKAEGSAKGSAKVNAIGDAREGIREGIRYDAMTREEVDAAYEANLPGSYEAYLDVLRDDVGADEFERYALENCLI
jgi:hypothetical protein